MNQFDTEKIYCRKLGHELCFEYCRQENNKLPCFKVINCWFERFDIKQYIQNNFSQSEQESIFQPPTNKVVSLLDLIEKAKQVSPQSK